MFRAFDWVICDAEPDAEVSILFSAGQRFGARIRWHQICLGIKRGNRTVEVQIVEEANFYCLMANVTTQFFC